MKKKTPSRQRAARLFWAPACLAALVWTAAACGAACAAEPDTAPEDSTAAVEETSKPAAASDVFSLGEIVVEAEEETISKVATVDTISKETMDLNSARDVADAMKAIPSVVLTNGTRNEKTFSIRGFNQRYIPVLYDGIPMYVPYDGYVDVGKFYTGNLSQVSVSKGISSVLYGPNTMGGVVNLVSRKPVKPFEFDFDAGLTEGPRYDANTNLGARKGKFYIMGGFGYTDQHAFVLSHDHDKKKSQPGRRRENSYIDDYTSASGKIGFEPADGHEYAIGYNFITGDWGLPPEENTVKSPRYWQFSEWEKNTYYFAGDTKITEDLRLKTRLYRDEYYNVMDSYDNDKYNSQTAKYAFHSTYDDYTHGASMVLRTTYIPSNTLSGSFHFKQDVHREQDNRGIKWERYETETYSWGLEDDIAITDRLSLLIGASYDRQHPEDANGGDLRDDEDSFNPQAGLSYAATDSTLLHASVGKKTRFPSLKELYSGLMGSNIPNPELKTEKSINYEAGVTQALPRDSEVRAALFLSDIDDLIVNRQLTSQQSQYQNIGMALFKGLELSARTGWIEHNELTLNYTFLDAQDRSHDRTSSKLEYQPRHNLYISNLYTFNKYLQAFCALNMYSQRYFQDPDKNRAWHRVDGFFTLDFKLIGTITKNLSVEAGAKNLLDELYYYNHGFPQAGRTFFTAVRGKF